VACSRSLLGLEECFGGMVVEDEDKRCGGGGGGGAMAWHPWTAIFLGMSWNTQDFDEKNKYIH